MVRGDTWRGHSVWCALRIRWDRVVFPVDTLPAAYAGRVTPAPSPSPLDVVVHSGPADWWVILAGLGPLAVLVAALLAFYINWHTLQQRTAADKTALDQKREADAQALTQKTQADSRAEWWRRTQWALDRALDEDEGIKALGLATWMFWLAANWRARRSLSCSTSPGKTSQVMRAWTKMDKRTTPARRLSPWTQTTA
jgi:hypothetical protein